MHPGDLLARCTFPAPGTPVTCAVSGGADSMTLMVLAHAAGLNVTAHHVDHGLRPDSSRDIEVITPIAAQLGIAVITHRLDVPTGPNLEARAREARYAVMPADVMTGHTADDQAETVLINILRGASSRGMAAMRPGFSRPLLALRRSDTVEFCRANQIAVVDDETNTDPQFLRNRIRHELLPMLNEISRRDVVPILARNADLLRADDDFLDALAAHIDPTDARALADAPPPLAFRAIRRWLSDPYPPDLATIHRVLEVARGDVPACDVGQNRQIRRSKQQLRIEKVG